MTTVYEGDSPLTILCRVADANRWRVCLTIDGPAGKSVLDTIDVWDGHPRKLGSNLVARTPLCGRPLEVAVREVLHQLPGDD